MSNELPFIGLIVIEIVAADEEVDDGDSVEDEEHEEFGAVVEQEALKQPPSSHAILKFKSSDSRNKKKVVKWKKNQTKIKKYKEV